MSIGHGVAEIYINDKYTAYHTQIVYEFFMKNQPAWKKVLVHIGIII